MPSSDVDVTIAQRTTAKLASDGKSLSNGKIATVGIGRSLFTEDRVGVHVVRFCDSCRNVLLKHSPETGSIARSIRTTVLIAIILIRPDRKIAKGKI